MVRITTAQKANAPTPGSIVITEPNATSAPSNDSIKMSIRSSATAIVPAWTAAFNAAWWHSA